MVHYQPVKNNDARLLQVGRLLSHVQMMETRLAIEQSSGGSGAQEAASTASFTADAGDSRGVGANERLNREPKLSMCRVLQDSVVVLAYTHRCVSVQLLPLLEEGNSATTPVPVLSLSGVERITCATVVSLENPELSADDTIIVPEFPNAHQRERSTGNRDTAITKMDNPNDNTYKEFHQSQQAVQFQNQNPVISLMSGGIMPMADCPRVAIVVGTTHGRILSLEFSVQPQSQLLRRNHFIGKDILPYYQPLPNSLLTDGQKTEYERGDSAGTHTRRRSMSATSSLDESDDGEANDEKTAIKDDRPKAIVPFEPSSGVASIDLYVIIEDSKPVSYVWISFGDGTIIRMHHAGLFSSVVQKQTELDPEDAFSMEHALGKRSLVRCQLQFPPTITELISAAEDHSGEAEVNGFQVVVVPLPKYHPSPLAPFPTWKRPEVDERKPGLDHASSDGSDAASKNNSLKISSRDVLPETYEAIAYCKANELYSFPTLAFYTTEDQLDGRIQGGDPTEEKALSKPNGNILGAVGAFFMGAFGGGGGNNISAKSKKIRRSNSSDSGKATSTAAVDNIDEWDPRIPFPSMNLSPMSLYCGHEYYDSPRQVTYCTIDPAGNLAAVADVLGRVLLIDLSTKQAVRIWKGYRDTSCYWLEVPQNTESAPWKKPCVLYLVIHSRQRRVLEVWRTRHGLRVKSMQVGREAQVLSCREITKHGRHVTSCYLAHSNVPSSFNQLEKIVIKEDENTGGALPNHPHGKAQKRDVVLSQEAAIRFNRLQQLLGNTNVPCQSIDVYKTLTHIRNQKDLATALDLLAVAPALEEKMKVDGSTFQRLAISHCRERVDDNVTNKDQSDNPHAQLLRFKIQYFTQVSDAYDVIHRYETSPDSSRDVADPGGKLNSNWVVEALGWANTFKQVTGNALDSAVMPVTDQSIKYYSFAGSCVPPKQWQDATSTKYQVHFSDSSRIRSSVLVHVLKPLLGDVFAYNTVDQLFDALGIAGDNEYLLKCFGEWYITLPVDEAIQKASFSSQSSMCRWVSQIASKCIDAKVDDAADSKCVVMKSLYDICRGSDDLVRAFWLATLCREVLSRAAEEKEEQTYGKITKDQVTSDWEQLLRQIRVCLLVSLRLYNIRFGSEPISVESVDRKGNFSVYEWLAYDELAMSHDNEEITSLEDACRVSSHSFDPSTAAGDDPVCSKILQSSCLSASISEEERAEYLVDIYDDDKLGALLLFMKPYNDPSLLLAHRSLILFTRWGRNPSDLSLMKNGLEALKSLNMTRDYKNIAAAVRLDVWQNHIRPVYRAFLVGFDDVQEISAEVVAPLFHDQDWVAQFGSYAAEVLTLYSKIKWAAKESPNELGALAYPPPKGEAATWPPRDSDAVLCRLVKRTQAVNTESFKAHRAMVCALRVSKDVDKLSECIPSFYHMFTPTAIYDSVQPLEDDAAKRNTFVRNAIVEHTENYSGPMLDEIELREIGTLATLWGINMVEIRTFFLISMYESGKDRYVDELLTKVTSTIDVPRFCREGIIIVCRRLNYLLHVQTQTDMHEVMSLLDAEMCEWIRGRAYQPKGSSGNGGVNDIPVENTHLFALRLLSLAAVSDISKEERIKIHSLIVLSGTIVKALESDDI